MAKKWVKKQIEKLRALAFTEIPQKIQSTPMTLDTYLNECRLALNTIAVSALTGGEFVESKKKKDGDKQWKIKFDHRLPDKSELLEIADIMNGYIGRVENPFLQRFVNQQQPQAEGSEEDMSIPHQESAPVDVGTNVPKIEKISRKKLEAYVFGKDGKPSICKMLLTSIDCIQIAALGEDLRKKDNKNKMLIIGGVALLLTGAAIAGVCLYNHHKKGDIDDMLDEMDAETITDISDDDAPIVSIIA